MYFFKLHLECKNRKREMNSEDIVLREINQSQKDTFHTTHLSEVSREVRYVEAESEPVGASGGRGGTGS